MIKLNNINSVRSLSGTLSVPKCLPKGLATAAISISVFLAACGDDTSKTSGGSVEDQEVVAISDKTVSGVSQKGPFVNGSSVTVQELDGETLAQTGNSYEGKIKNDMGEFSVKVTKLASQYALLKANGFYRNEVSGEKSKSQVTLYALTDLSNRNEVNVNLLTHLEYERSLYLVSADSMSVTDAKKQAEKEVLASFGIDGNFANSEDLSIFGKGDESAALLAVSILMQGDLSEADFSERLADYAADIETDGKWDDAKTATEIADWGAAKSLGQSLSYIRTKITDWGLSAEVPAFEKYVDNYWWRNYGLGTCEEKRDGEIKKNENSQSRNYKSYFICENGAWRVASDTEYDTYQQKCDEDGKIVYGNVNKDYAYDCDAQRWRHASNVESALGGCVEKRFGKVAETEGVYYICQKREWRKAADIEKDTYGWKTGNDADVKYGDVVKTNCYVFEDSAWRSGESTDCSLGLRGCTALRQDTVGKGSDKVYHICDAKSWRDATTYEKDTFGWKDSTDGAIKKGDVTDTVYVFDKTAWRVTSNIETKLGGCVSAIADSVGKVGSKYYICKSNKWVEASVLEYDTYHWVAGNDGDSKSGSVNAKNCYVYEGEAWRSGNTLDCSLGLRGCTTLRQDTVGKGSDNVWHICDSKSWRDATTYEKDTFGWKDSTDGAIKKGNVTDTVYVFDKTAWRVTSNVEAKLGGCVSTIADSVGKVGSTYYICKSNKWVEASAIEYDTYRWVAGKDGDSKTGSVDAKNCYVYEENVWRSGNTSDCSLGLRGCTALRQDTVGKGRDNVWYKCDSQTWRTATNIEKDTATWGVGEFDGEIRTGQINETIYYIYETNTKTWRNATALEYDTYQMICSEDGKMFNGNVNTMTKYVCDNGIFRMANEIEMAADSACTSYNINDYHVLPRVNGNRNYSYYKCTENGWSFTTEKLNQGTMTDLRDGHVYKIIGVKTQMWMAENLNYADSVNYPSMLGKNWCMNDADSCAKYGRYYTWSAAIDSVYWAKQGKYCGVGFEDTCGLPQKVRGVCLEGWSMPNEQDWNILLMAVENDVTFLQAKGFSFWKKAADEYGFTALPAGRYYAHDEIIGNNLNNGDPTAYFWTSTERNNSFGGVEEYGNEAMFFDINKNSAHIGSYYKFDGFSVRCIKDEE